MNKNCPEIVELRKRIEDDVKRKMKSPADFIYLDNIIWDKLHENISTTTLKRLWGYIDGAEETRHSTLNLLSRFLGYNHWDHFLEDLDHTNPFGSKILNARKLTTNDLNEGDIVEVAWQPNHHCMFKHLGNGNFVVERSINSYLRTGDRFECSLFIEGEPLYINNLKRRNKEPLTLVLAKETGITTISNAR